MSVESEDLLSEATNALKKIQDFDTRTLDRSGDLGELNFKDAIEPAQRIVDLYKKLSADALQDFPDNLLTIIKDKAINDHNLFKKILEVKFEKKNMIEQPLYEQMRDLNRHHLIDLVKAAYSETFEELHSFISYSLLRAVDFQLLDADAKSMLKETQDQSSEITNQLAAHEEDAKRALEQIRNVAAEAGVSQQAKHFKTESADQKSAADVWEKRTYRMALGLGAFAVLSFFVHKIPFLTPESAYETAQLAVSKVLVFSTIAYMLYLSARNFMNHKHNSIVNKHRQNALMTYTTLVEASEDNRVKDAILLQAATSIFTPQSTGYTNTSGESASPKSVVEILSKPLSSGD